MLAAIDIPPLTQNRPQKSGMPPRHFVLAELRRTEADGELDSERASRPGSVSTYNGYLVRSSFNLEMSSNALTISHLAATTQHNKRLTGWDSEVAACEGCSSSTMPRGLPVSLVLIRKLNCEALATVQRPRTPRKLPAICCPQLTC